MILASQHHQAPDDDEGVFGLDSFLSDPAEANALGAQSGTAGSGANGSKLLRKTRSMPVLKASTKLLQQRQQVTWSSCALPPLHRAFWRYEVGDMVAPLV